MNRSLRTWKALLALAAAAPLTGCDVAGGLLGGTSPVTDASAVKAIEAPQCETPTRDAELTDQLLRLINIERLDIGAVQIDPALSAIAADYACEMIDDGFFGHAHPMTGEGLADRAAAAGYEYLTLGENLAAGIRNMPDVVDAWKGSATHRDVMLDPGFTKAGISVRLGGDYQIYCVLLLAQPVE